jgi:hypothetical protein
MERYSVTLYHFQFNLTVGARICGHTDGRHDEIGWFRYFRNTPNNRPVVV